MPLPHLYWFRALLLSFCQSFARPLLLFLVSPLPVMAGGGVDGGPPDPGAISVELVDPEPLAIQVASTVADLFQGPSIEAAVEVPGQQHELAGTGDNGGSGCHLSMGDALGQIDWDSIEIESRWEEEGTQEIPKEDILYLKLGLQLEDEGHISMPNMQIGDSDDIFAMPDVELIPEDNVIVYDKLNPIMKVGSLYPNMKEFRLAMRQYAINKEFELGIEATNTQRYRAFCQGDDCPWKIHARVNVKGSPTIIVSAMTDVHTCTSSSRRRTATPTSGWVAGLVLPMLLSKPNIGAKELQRELEKRFGVTISYDTVWKGREKAMVELHGTWEDSFRLLFSWKEAILEKMSDSVVEIDVREEDGKLYFSRFFCALGPCIRGFLLGCRPYLSIDSTALNGRWNGHLPAVTGVDGHNWMFPVAFGFFGSETEDNWTWFMIQLRKAIGDLPLLAVCSDACKGLLNAVKKVFPYAEKRECFRHLLENFVKKHTGKEHLFPAARAYMKEVKAKEKYCSCLEWEHTGKPCQHGLVVIIAQQFRDVGLEEFVDDYFSVEKFKKAYEGRIEQMRDKFFWPKVDFAQFVGAPIAKRTVGRQRKNRIKGCLEGGHTKKKTTLNNERVMLRGQYKCPNCGELGHRKNSPKCHLNGTKKRKRKQKKNKTTQWFGQRQQVHETPQPAAPEEAPNMATTSETQPAAPEEAPKVPNKIPPRKKKN